MTTTDSRQFRYTTLAAAAVLLFGLMAVTVVRVARVVGAVEVQQLHDLTDLSAKELEKPPLSDEDNAAAWLQAGAAAIVWVEAEKTAVGEATLKPHDAWPTGLSSQVRAALDRHRGALETLHRAAAIERSNYGIAYGQGLAAEIPVDAATRFMNSRAICTLLSSNIPGRIIPAVPVCGATIVGSPEFGPGANVLSLWATSPSLFTNVASANCPSTCWCWLENIPVTIPSSPIS